MEPREDLDEVHSSQLQLHETRIEKSLRSSTEFIRKESNIQKGTIIATTQAANLVPPKLAPKYVNENNNNNKQLQPTKECIDKLFSKLDLKGLEQWDSETQMKLKQVFKDHHHIFALDDLEL